MSPRIAQAAPRRQIIPLALDIGRARAAHVGAFLPIQTEPAEILDDRLAELRAAAVTVQILDPQDQRAAPLSRPRLRRPKRGRMAQMQITGGRGRDSAAITSSAEVLSFEGSGKRRLNDSGPFALKPPRAQE